MMVPWHMSRDSLHRLLPLELEQQDHARRPE
jgi:hypothetical protein